MLTLVFLPKSNNDCDVFSARYTLTGHRSPVTKVLFHPAFRYVTCIFIFVQIFWSYLYKLVNILGLYITVHVACDAQDYKKTQKN